LTDGMNKYYAGWYLAGRQGLYFYHWHPSLR
jgi:hypothetical protein